MSGQSSKVVHWPTGNAGWHTALTQFAKTVNPKTQLPKGVYLRSNSHTLTIYDGYPKARFHFLVLPRIPFSLDHQANGNDQNSALQSSPSSSSSSKSKPSLALAGGKLTLGNSSKGETVPSAHLHSLTSLLASPYAAEVLKKMRTESESVVRLIKEEMRHSPLPATLHHLNTSSNNHSCQVEWGVRVGFHAVPSMDTVHLHIISDDLVSDRLKHKKHYQSFHPNHGFWLDLDMIEELVQQGRKSLPRSEAQYESLLKAPLISFHDGKEYPNMPKLKAHLEQAWIDGLRQKREKIRTNGKLAGTKHHLERNSDSM